MQCLSQPAKVLRAKEIAPEHIRTFVKNQGHVLKRMKRSSGAEFRVLPSAFILIAGTEDQVLMGEEEIDNIVGIETVRIAEY